MIAILGRRPRRFHDAHDKDKLTLGQASRLAAMALLEFQHLLASRRIPVHYDVADFERDLEALSELGRL